MKRIFKYHVGTNGVSRVRLPIDAKVLSTNVQDGKVQIWAEVDDEAALEDRHFIVYGTGHEMLDTEHQVYVGTIFDNPFVWHVYEYTGGVTGQGKR